MTTPAEDYNLMWVFDHNSSYEDYYNMSYEDYYNYDENVEMCETEHVDYFYHHLSLYVYPLIAGLGLLGNLLVIVIYSLYKKTKSKTDVYLLNIAVADLLFVLALPFILYNEQNNWVMGDGACKILNGAYSLNLYSGLLLLWSISIDRYVTINHCHVMCAVAWGLALLISLPTFIYSGLHENILVSHFPDVHLTSSESDNYEREPPMTLSNNTMTIPTWGNLSEYTDYYDYSENSTNDYSLSLYREEEKLSGECKIRFSAWHINIIVPSLQMGIGLLLPRMVIMCCAIRTMLKTTDNFCYYKPKERVVLTVVLVFIICHLPYNITRIVNIITMREEKECSSEKAMLVGLRITKVLAYMHCCLNPILYAFSGVCFRRHFRKFLQDIRCVRKNYTPAKRSSFSVELA